MSEPIRFEVGKPGVDPTLPNVTLAIDGVDYALCYDHAAIADVGRLTGINMLTAVASNQPSFEGVIACFWAAAKKAKPEFTYEAAAALIDLSNVYGVLEAVRVAWGASIPDPKKADDGDAGEVAAQATSPEA